jgi:hypothetical protein
MNFKEVIKETLACLEADGWCQGVTHHYDGGHCLGGAIETVGPPDHFSVFEEPSGFIGGNNLYLSPVSVIIRWNDDPDRTFEDVRNLLERAMSQ